METLQNLQEPTEQANGVNSVTAVEGKGSGIRVGALALDGILVWVMGAITVPIGPLLLGKPPMEAVIDLGRVAQDGSAQLLSLLIGLIVGMLYFALFEWLYGATPGKLLLRLRVVKVDGRCCDLVSALVRSALRPAEVFYWGIAAFVNTFSFGLPVLSFMAAPLRQRIGDKAARTIVADSREPWLPEPRPRWWLLVAAGLSLLIAIGMRIGFMQYLDRGAAPGDAYIAQAGTAHLAKDYARAAELWERALEAGIPEDRLPNTYFLLGNDYYLLGDLDKAIQAQQRALEIDAAFYPSWTSLGTAYWSNGELDRAEECYRRSVELAPDWPEGHVNLGWLYLERGEVEQALRFFERALELDPHSATAHAYTALAQAVQGHFEEADASLRVAKENGYANWQQLQEEVDSLKLSWQGP